MPGPTFNVREITAQRIDPTYSPQARTSGAAPNRGPIQPLGLQAGQDVIHLTQLSRALSSLTAASISIQPPPPAPDGLGIQLQPGSLVDTFA